MTRITPGTEQVIVICAAPDCDFVRRGVGKRKCDEALRLGQRHADRTGHMVSASHKHTAIVDWDHATDE